MKKSYLAMVVAGVVASGVARAWDVPLPEAHLIGTTLRDAPHGRIAGDFDLDGDSDLVIETTQTNLVWLKNVDDATSNWVGVTISSGLDEAPLAVADLDNDGDPDVLTFYNNGVFKALHWYENAATGTVWTQHSVYTNLPGGAVVANVDLGDLDRDGLTDMIISYVNSGTHLYWLVNNGAGLWTQHVIATNVSAYVVICDVNGDGLSDVERISSGTVVGLLNQPGASSNWSSTVLATNTLSASSFAMLDVDQDGDTDMVLVGNFGSWYENAGTGSNWIFHALSDFRTSEEAVPFDVDGDGDDDVVTDNTWYDNPGRRPGSWLRRSLTNVVPGSVQLLGLADVDGDGDEDILTQGVSNTLHWVEVARPTLPRSFGSARVVVTNVANTSDIEAADIDGDGDLDLVVSSYSGGLYWFQSAGLGSNWTRHVIATNALDFSAVAVADLDADGDLDVAASYDSGGQLLWYRNVGGQGTSWLASTVATTVVSIRDLKAARINNDPFPDLAATAAFGDDVLEWRNIGGSGSNWVQRYVTNDIQNPYGIDLGDLDHDGDPDIVATELSGTQLRWFRNPIGNAGTNWVPRVITTNAPGYAGVALADLDGDGDLDVAAVSPQTDSLDLWINTDGTGQAWTNYSVVATFVNPYSVIARDFDRDGKMDLATTEAGDNRASIFYNVGTYAIWQRRNLATTFTGTLALAAADLDDNGTTDLAVGASPGSSIVWFPKDGNTDLRLTKTVKTSYVNFDAPESFTLTVTNYGPDDATSLVVTDALPAEFVWTSDTAGAGPPAGTNLIWNIGTLGAGFSVTCVVQGVTVPGSIKITVTNRARLHFDGVVAVASNALASAAFTIDDLIGTVATNFDGASDAVFADMDGDGWEDVVACASNANTVAVYRNRGYGTNWTLAGSTTALTNPTRLVVADFNRDGVRDVAAISPKTGRLVWWIGSTLSNPVTIATGQTGILSVEAADFDRDGDTDLLACVTGSTSVVWFQNAGGPATNWTRRVVSASAGRALSAAAADLDCDGDADIVAVNAAGQFARFMNLNGVGTLWSTNIIGSVSAASIVTTADLDGDGDSDVVVGSYQNGTIALWENVDGAGGSWTQTVDYLFHSGITDVTASDWDGDGDIDLVTGGSASGSILWWENLDSRGRNWTQHEMMAGIAGVASVSLGDADHDGTPDYTAAVATAGRVRWGAGDPHPWPGFISDANRHVLISNLNETAGTVLFDADADGDLDIAAFSRSNKCIQFWRNLDRSGTRWESANIVSNLGYLGALAHGDLDNDGDEDLVSFPDLGNEGIWGWYNADGLGTVWTQRVICGSGVVFDAHRGVLCDLDRDGDLDLAVASKLGSTCSIYWFANGGAAGGGWSTNFITSACTNAVTIDAGDLDGDGDPDLVTGGDALFVLANSGDATSWTLQTVPVGVGFTEAVRITDLDRNGTNDILYTSGANVRLLRFKNPFTNTTDTLLGFTQGSVSQIRAIDFDADGDLDILTSAASTLANTGKVVVLENIATNGLLYARTAQAAIDCVNAYDIETGDIDGDGDPDLAASFYTTLQTNQPALAWWPNRASNSVAINKRVAPILVSGATSVTWTITVSNSLSVAADSVVVTDWFPPIAVWVSDNCGVGNPGTNAWIWNIGTLLPGATSSCTITALVPAATASLINRARVTSFGTPPELAIATAELDSDGDGLMNIVDTDDDNDLIPDLWELLYGLNPLNSADALADTDNDGFTNLDEYIAGTSPTDLLDYFRVTYIAITNGVAVATTPMLGDRRYSLEFSDSLHTSFAYWSGLSGPFGISGGLGVLTNTPNATNRFYRVRVFINP